MHVHFREPGFSYKETIRSGSLAAARGGCTAVCTMPNLNPVPDSPENLKPRLEAIQKGACIAVYPYAAITKGEQGQILSDMEALAPNVVAFSDDGRGVQDRAMMEAAMVRAKALDKLVWDPRKRFRIPLGNAFSVWDLSARYKIDPRDFLSRGRATPFKGWTVQGKCLATFYGGQAVYQARK